MGKAAPRQPLSREAAPGQPLSPEAALIRAIEELRLLVPEAARAGRASRRAGKTRSVLASLLQIRGLCQEEIDRILQETFFS